MELEQVHWHPFNEIEAWLAIESFKAIISMHLPQDSLPTFANSVSQNAQRSPRAITQASLSLNSAIHMTAIQSLCYAAVAYTHLKFHVFVINRRIAERL